MVTKTFDPKALLEKHGWKFGSGLGKDEGGIKEAIKVELKMDRAGMGYDASEKYSFQWWDHVFNTAANSIEVVSDENGVSIKKTSTVDVSTKKKSKINKTKPKTYGCFVKSATLTNDGLEVKDPNSDSDSSSDSDTGIISKMTDEELFKACGGMTGHKGARHGLSLRGKLLRIQQHDEQYLRSRQNPSDSKPNGNSAAAIVPSKMKTKTEASQEKSTEVEKLSLSSSGQNEMNAVSPSFQERALVKRNKKEQRESEDRKDKTEGNTSSDVDYKLSVEETTAKPKSKKGKIDDLDSKEKESNSIEAEEMTSLKFRKQTKKNTECEDQIFVPSEATSDGKVVSLDKPKAEMNKPKKRTHDKVSSHGDNESLAIEEQSVDQRLKITENSKKISKKLKKQKEQENTEKKLLSEIIVMNQTKETETDGLKEQKHKLKQNKKNQDKGAMHDATSIVSLPVEGTSTAKKKCKKYKKKNLCKTAVSNKINITDQPVEDTTAQKKKCRENKKTENGKDAFVDETVNHTEEPSTEESKLQNRKCKKSRKKRHDKETFTDEVINQAEELAYKSKLKRKKHKNIMKCADETGTVLLAPEITDHHEDRKAISKKSKKCKRVSKERDDDFLRVHDSEETHLEMENHIILRPKEKRHKKNGCMEC